MKKLLLCLCLLMLIGCGDPNIGSSEENNSASSGSIISTEITSSEIISNESSINSTVITSEDIVSSGNTNSSEEVVFNTLEVNFTEHNYSGVDLNDNEQAKDYVKGLFGEYLVSFDCSKVFADKLDNDSFIKMSSQNSDGYMNLVFSFNVKKIDIRVKNWTKYVNYTSTYNCDSPTFYINDIDIEMVNVVGELSSYNTYSVDLNTNNIKLESKNGRSVIESMTIYYF